jgi:DNA-binding response OmpR family regulator
MARIVIADDNRELASALADFLVGEGHTVAIAADGLMALQAIRADPPDIVVADVQMPLLDGPALLARLAREGLDIPAILMSASTAIPLDVGIPVLAKPFDLDALLAAIDNTVGGRRNIRRGSRDR